MRFITLSLFVSMFALSGCPSPECDGDCADPTDTDDPDCTNDCPADGEATITVLAKVGDENVTDATVKLDGSGDNDATGLAGDVLTVAAPDTITAKVGDGITHDGLPLENVDGMDFCSQAEQIPVTDGDDETRTVNLHAYFAEEFDCERDDYWYDASAPDFKGDHYDHTDDDKQIIQVDNCQQIDAQTSPTMGVMNGGDYMEVDGDHLILQTGGDERRYITESSVTATEFSLTLVNTQADAVVDLRCWKTGG